jgi:hypothetical protein
MSELSKLLDKLPNGTPFHLVRSADQSVSLPSRDEAFVRPILKLENNLGEDDPPIILISAPGAVGKSSLARFIASERNCHLWDLSKLRLGTNTFKGTLANAFDAEDYSQLVKDLRNGRLLFVLDAFDEAEIVSGWARVEEFLTELFSLVKNAPGHTLILLARSTTAQLMDIYLSDLAESNDLDSRHLAYSIDYFVESQAIEFIRLHLKKQGKVTQKTHNTAFREAVDKIFSLFYTVVKMNDTEKPWLSHEVKSFLGYAPVLQAIARYIAQFDNFALVQNTFINSDSLSDGTSLVSGLMNDLLLREQRKLVQQLKQTDIPEAAGWDSWESIYTPIEQLRRLFLHLQPNQEQRQRAFFVDEKDVPGWLVAEYSKALQNFIEQHPFVLNGTFTGPAFQDYTFARLLAEKCLYSEVKDAWHNVIVDDKAYIASPLFALLYLEINSGEASGDIAGYLYESAISRQGFQSQPRLIIIPREETESDLVHWFQIITEDEIINGDGMIHKQEVDMRFKLELDGDIPVTFTRRLSRSYIEVKGAVVLGRPDVVFELKDSEIICHTLYIHSNTIIVRNYSQREQVSIEATNYEQASHILNIDQNNPQTIAISWPNGQKHPWSNYYYEPIKYESHDFEEAVLALRRILSFFRKDRRDDFARYKQLVDHVVVGKRPIRQDLRNYLIEKQILTPRAHMYFLDMKPFESHGINFESMRQANIGDELQNFIREFLSWRSD